ncbi:MAG TPA: hypothetical protein VMQ46_09610 [Acidimicrobiia bacterium]|nr:hypothetical protein [Acidimicrobiia bacterium]
MRVGLLVTGDIAVRSAHSLQAHPGIDDVVVIGPATSKSFEVVQSGTGCDFLLGTGGSAPDLARKHGVPLIWDGEGPEEGVAVWGASPAGLAVAIGAREPDPRLVAVAHPLIENGATSRTTRFPDPIGRVGVRDVRLGGRPVALARSPNDFAACLTIGAGRRVTVVDHGGFLAGVALAAGVAVTNGTGDPVWSGALSYLEAATEMGLVMAERA